MFDVQVPERKWRFKEPNDQKKRINKKKKKNARIYFFHGGATSIEILNRFGVLVQYHGVEPIKLIKSALFDSLNPWAIF